MAVVARSADRSHRPADGAAEQALLRVLRRDRARVGVSPCFPSLRDTPQALRFARLALAGLRGTGPGVARFDDDPLAMVVAAAPAEAAHLVGTVLRPVVELPVVERAVCCRPWSTGSPPRARPPRRAGACSCIPTPSATGCAVSRN
ncbi:hypothetical protein [Streptomyces stelliscabiei]|uniref:hypothetical protein n=1 Tax=Streptomyces stelliscabiei TaxID=146820 RepID=UPI003A95D4CD